MRWLFILTLPFLALLAGCAATEPYAPPTLLARSNLLFDTAPGYPAAGQMIRYGDWPAAQSPYQDSETQFYRQSLYDVQGGWPNTRDYTLRRFQLYRTGWGSR